MGFFLQQTDTFLKKKSKVKATVLCSMILILLSTLLLKSTCVHFEVCADAGMTVDQKTQPAVICLSAAAIRNWG